MDFIRRIMNLFHKDSLQEHDELLHFISAASDSEDRIVTCYPSEEGMLIFCAFDAEQWSMIQDLAELSNRDVSDVVQELADNNEIATFCVDPTDMF